MPARLTMFYAFYDDTIGIYLEERAEDKQRNFQRISFVISPKINTFIDICFYYSAAGLTCTT